MRTITTKQIQFIKALMAKKGLLPESEHLAFSFSKERTTHVSEMTTTEANELIKHLKGEDPADKMRKKILSAAWDMGWVTSSNPPKVDIDSVNEWCIKYGHGHKELNKYTLKELPILVSQFERMKYGYN